MEKPSTLVKGLRRKMKLTLKDFGKIFDREPDMIHKYESGVSIPPGDVVMKMIDIRDKMNGGKK